jgi:hypothetical protein
MLQRRTGISVSRRVHLFIIVTVQSEMTNLVIYKLNYYDFHTNLTIIHHKKFIIL